MDKLKALRERLKALWAKYRRVVFKLMGDAVTPCLTALAWGIYVAYNKNSAVDGLNAASLAFFLILSIQNLIQRAAKVVYDQEHGERVLGRLDALDQGFDTVQQGIEALRAQGFAPPPLPQEEPPVAEPAAPQPSEPHDPGPAMTPPPSGATASFPFSPPSDDFAYWYRLHSGSSELLFFTSQAEAAIRGKHYFAATLVAAVGFEYAVRSAAARMDIPENKRSLGQLLRVMASKIKDEATLDRLTTLNRIRNGLVHGEQQGSAITREQAIELVEAFRRGADYLAVLTDQFPDKYQLVRVRSP